MVSYPYEETTVRVSRAISRLYFRFLKQRDLRDSNNTRSWSCRRRWVKVFPPASRAAGAIDLSWVQVISSCVSSMPGDRNNY